MTDAPAADSADSIPAETDVVVVGGGPAGCAAGIFTARYGLDTVIFDRGPASLRRCAYLENYPGFPGGIGIDTFYDLLHDHVETAGCSVVPDVVESVDHDRDHYHNRDGDGEGDPASGDGEGNSDRDHDRDDAAFVVETGAGRTIVASRVVAATRYDGAYLRGLDDPDAMFHTYAGDEEAREYLDPDWADADGRTPVPGCYVATPAGERDVQAVVAAGRGAHVARSLLADYRHDRGYPEGVAPHYDWTRPPSEFEGEAGDRDHWGETFDVRAGDHDADPERLADLREREVDRIFSTEMTDAEVAERSAAGQRRLAANLDPEHVLDAIDDDRIRDYLADE